ncbi:MAG: 2-amino-4-hydroxy-6-hydroxymethyldihydropteridine diphosphokinase [Nitrospirota bacterium]
MPIAYIGIGSNIGNKIEHCRKALELLEAYGKLKAVSSFYCTEPVGYPDQEDFVNAVAMIETGLLPEYLLEACHAIENMLGRRRTVLKGPRIIDLDILLYENQIIQAEYLIIPHPRMASRKFVLIPLCEIAPEVMHPLLQKSVSSLLEEVQDSHRVKLYKQREQA